MSAIATALHPASDPALEQAARVSRFLESVARGGGVAITASGRWYLPAASARARFGTSCFEFPTLSTVAAPDVRFRDPMRERWGHALAGRDVVASPFPLGVTDHWGARGVRKWTVDSFLDDARRHAELIVLRGSVASIAAVLEGARGTVRTCSPVIVAEATDRLELLDVIASYAPADEYMILGSQASARDESAYRADVAIAVPRRDQRALRRAEALGLQTHRDLLGQPKSSVWERAQSEPPFERARVHEHWMHGFMMHPAALMPALHRLHPEIHSAAPVVVGPRRTLALDCPRPMPGRYELLVRCPAFPDPTHVPFVNVFVDGEAYSATFTAAPDGGALLRASVFVGASGGKSELAVVIAVGGRSVSGYNERGPVVMSANQVCVRRSEGASSIAPWRVE